VSALCQKQTLAARPSNVRFTCLQADDPERIVVEAYPGVIARAFIGTRSYKNDSRAKQTDEQRTARCELFESVTASRLIDYGFSVSAPPSLTGDPTGDQLDCFAPFKLRGRGHNAKIGLVRPMLSIR
jgi:hypothetical protein